MENQDIEVKILPGKSTVTQKLHVEYQRKEDSKLEAVEKPSYHKRSVTSLPRGSKCAKHFGDIADAYVAVLLVKTVDGRQLLAGITEEDPLYLGKSWVRG